MVEMIVVGLVAGLVAGLSSCALTLLVLRRLFEERVRPAVEARLEELGDELSNRVRRSVRQGFLDAVVALPSAEVLQGTSRAVSDTASSLVRGGLGWFFRGVGEPEGGDDEGDP